MSTDKESVFDPAYWHPSAESAAPAPYSDEFPLIERVIRAALSKSLNLGPAAKPREGNA